MTSINRLTLAVGLIISLLSLNAYAQSAELTLNHFATDGISFYYLAGYSVTDDSGEEAQKFVITRKESSVQITILVTRRLVQEAEEAAAIKNFTEPIIRQAGITLGYPNPPRGTPLRIDFRGKQADGVRLQSAGDGTTTADVIWFRSRSRLVGLTFIRSDADEKAESRAWEIVRSSLKIYAPVGVEEAGEVSSTGRAIKGGVLNGKALSLPKPPYPPAARAARASGVVSVQVLIDEAGNVIEAEAISGHHLLQPACVMAAREAKFSPTLLAGEPVKVTGVIQYNFVRQ